ncbi:MULTISPECIES: F-box-like domain-containing protein [Burkholderiaceae]|uniref:F-box-like domain-containing protein n=1 Tax=Burkholderiaceae TaxID=119060 RepID=UPI0009638331|nr:MULTISPECIES: F-box-like domain-containing protein [Burkholderiaceae]MCG1018802.1 F-box protein [Mycetohabitans sp. B4]SIT74894.1 F-box-like [Burkholderia sp. b13]
MPHPLSLSVTSRASQGTQTFEPVPPAAYAADAGGCQTTAQRHYGAHRLDGLVDKQPSNSPQAATGLNEMPTEILANIFRGLPLSDMAQLSEVNRKFRQILLPRRHCFLVNKKLQAVRQLAPGPKQHDQARTLWTASLERLEHSRAELDWVIQSFKLEWLAPRDRKDVLDQMIDHVMRSNNGASPAAHRNERDSSLPSGDNASARELQHRTLLHHLKSQIEALPERERAPALTRIIGLQGKEAMTIERLFPRIQDGNVEISNRNYAIHLLNYGFSESEAAMLAGERDQHALENPDIEICTAVFAWRPKDLPLHKFVSLLEQAIGEARRHGDKHSVDANDAIAGEERSRLVQRLRNLSGNAAPNAHPLSRPTLNRIVSRSTLDHIERLRTGA